jgi:ubiquinone/menaquinone biosynthesis C-methylase UbiE
VLEVGGGTGDLGERLVRELGVELVEVDLSARMVDLMRARGLDARLGDVQQLPFADGEFDCAVAAWMLYHVPDLDRGLRELVRVLRPGGRLVAVTVGAEHIRELWQAMAADPPDRSRLFQVEAAADQLAPHFARIERRDANGWVSFDEPTARAYVTSGLFDGDVVPHFTVERWPLVAQTRSAVFVAEKAVE